MSHRGRRKHKQKIRMELQGAKETIIKQNPFEDMTNNNIHFENETLSFLYESNFTYDECIEYLLNENDYVSGDYVLRTQEGTMFRKNPNITKTGYEIHHIGENEIAELSHERYWHMSDYQSRDMLVYADYIQHCWLHYLIAKEDKSLLRNLGWGGLFNHRMLERVSAIISADDYKNLLYLVSCISEKMKERVLNMRRGITPSPAPVSIREQAEAEKWQRLYETYPRGITKITSKDYGKQLAVKTGVFDRCGINIVYVLRTEQDIFAFIGEAPEKEKFYFLSGGAVSLAVHTPDWYFSKLDDYFTICSDFVFKYKQLVTPISNYIKSIGGTGYIHGLIIDFDFFHHLKVDVENNRLIPYYAPSVSCRTIYPSLNVMAKLIAEKQETQALVPYKYGELIEYETSINCKGLETPICAEPIYNEEKGFYKRNRQVGSIYFSADSKIIKKWEAKFDTEEFWNEYYASLNRLAPI